MRHTPILTAAYGRDYASAEDAIAAFHAGSDFLLHDTASPWHGKPCSIRDLTPGPVFIRYCHRRRVTETHIGPSGEPSGEPQESSNA